MRLLKFLLALGVIAGAIVAAFLLFDDFEGERVPW